MNTLSNITFDQVRFLLVLMAVGSIIGGFFAGIVSSEIFYATMGSIITHFYQGTRIQAINDKVDEQHSTIQTMQAVQSAQIATNSQ
jgi:uncharacterized membrane protein YfcA